MRGLWVSVNLRFIPVGLYVGIENWFKIGGGDSPSEENLDTAREEYIVIIK